MTINEVPRPFQKPHSYGTRLTRSPLYRSKLWSKVIRPEFRAGCTQWNGEQVPNTLCIECYKQGRIIEGPVVDHIVAIKDGGSATYLKNMQALCASHHNSKSAREGNNRLK